jgi:hypothetical protein
MSFGKPFTRVPCFSRQTPILVPAHGPRANREDGLDEIATANGKGLERSHRGALA